MGVSATRFQSLSQQQLQDGKDSLLVVSAKGVEGENLSVGFVSAEGAYLKFHCTVGASGSVLISSDGSCV